MRLWRKRKRLTDTTLSARQTSSCPRHYWRKNNTIKRRLQLARVWMPPGKSGIRSCGTATALGIWASCEVDNVILGHPGRRAHRSSVDGFLSAEEFAGG